jgi:pimeloyl-ACP methyl ester carboxylesterase
MTSRSPAAESIPSTNASGGAPERIEAGGATFVLERLGPAGAPLRLVWLHGWGQSRKALKPLAQRFATGVENLLLDLPGFGEAPLPPADWGTAEYGAMLAEWLARGPRAGKTVLVCHSFGGRVALRLAAAYPELVDGLVLIAGAGLRRRRSLPARAKAFIARLAIRAARLVDGLVRSKLAEHLRERLGSADYRNAGPLRGVLVRTVTEDLTPEARQIACPVLLVYGERDDQTPPEFGTRFKALMASAELAVLPGFDHYTVLATGRHQVDALLRRFLADRLGLAL